MRRLNKTSLFILIFFIAGIYAGPLQAEIIVTNAEVTAVSDGRAKLKWETNEPTKATVYYGEKSEALIYRLDYGIFSYSHELPLTGLKKDLTYYYKIRAKNQGGQEIETFVQNFSTKNMKDSILPKFIYQRAEQVTANAVALRWVADEEVTADIVYNMESPTIEKERSTRAGSYKRDHILYIYDLKPQNNYYARVTMADRGGNKTNHTFYFTTLNQDNIKDGSGFRIYAVEPLNFNPDLIRPESATIKWRTTLVSQGQVAYGTKPGSYSQTVYANDQSYSLDHAAELADLKPNTTYYFKISARDSLYRKNLESPEYSFTTSLPRLVLGEKIEDTLDTDKDGLTDLQEVSLGTDSLDADTDNDSYADGLEVDNRYNPKGYGRLISQVLANIAIRNNYEKNKENDLKIWLDKNKIAYKNLDTRSWLTFSNAYAFGGYSYEDIVKTIQGQKTVHPTLPYSVWKNTKDYQGLSN